MAKHLYQIVIIDVEATCWETVPPKGTVSEITELGICLLEVTTGELTANEGILIKPENSEISPFCTSLTTITPEMVKEQGISFKEGCSILKKKYNTQGRAWASFGAYDQKQFQRQCTATGVGYPFSPSHINVKTLFALKARLPHEYGMAETLEHLNLPLEGTHHRGVDDAKNIAKILRWILA